MVLRIRWAIVASVLLFLTGNTVCQPLPELDRPTVEEAPVQAELSERQSWLVRESLAYALHKNSGVSPQESREIVAGVLEELGSHDLDFDFTLVLGVIVVESRGDTRAVSPVGARGLMQIMPQTGRYIAGRLSEEWRGAPSLFEMERNLRYGMWYLDHLQETFPEEQAFLEAYNWGPQRIHLRLKEKQGLPLVYSRRVLEAQAQLKEKMYDFYRTHYWRSLNLSEDPPYFGNDPPESPTVPGHRELLVHDAEGQLLRERGGLQQMSNLLPRGDGHLP